MTSEYLKLFVQIMKFRLQLLLVIWTSFVEVELQEKYHHSIS